MTIGKPARKPNPLTGKYPLTAKNQKFKQVVQQRRMETAAAAKAQRKAYAEKLNAAVGRAETAVGRAQAVERAAQAPNAPTTPAPEGDTPDSGQMGTQD